MRSQMRVLFKLAVICLMQFMPASSLEEGSACNNFDGTTGVCKVDRQCQWALEKLKSKEIKPAQFVRCGLKGTSSIICCKDNSVQISTTLKSTILVTDFVFIEPEDSTNLNEEKSQPPTRHRNERKSEIACELIKKIQIKEFDFHIINGEGADVGEFPHMTAIGFADEIDANVFSFDCGGSLIAKNFVLTAGHCVNSKVRVPKIVRLGKVSLDASTDAGDENIPQDIPVKKIHLHPKYSSRKKYNDIALLELQNNVEYQKTVRPACLYMSGDFIDGPLLISGWGRIDAKTMEKSRWLLKATLSEVPLESCRKIYKNLGVTQLPEGLNQTQLCATNSDNADACQGDSGGPIQQKFFVNEESYYYIVGVTSFGSGCGSDVPGVYTRVAEYLDWIESIVWPQTVSF